MQGLTFFPGFGIFRQHKSCLATLVAFPLVFIG